MGNVNPYRVTKAQARNLIRPVVLMPSGKKIQLEYYKGTTGGNTTTGWSKAYYRAATTPPTTGVLTTLIGNQMWELGVNIQLTKYYDELWWQTPLLGGVQTSLTSGSTSSAIMNISVIAADDSILGICNTTSISTTNSTSTTVKAYIPDPPDWSVQSLCTIASSGSFQATAYAFLFEWNWTAEVHTTGPVVPPTTATVYQFPLYATVNGVKV